ncbi:MAG: ferritin-like domain-containing protein [Bacillota bacterium]
MDSPYRVNAPYPAVIASTNNAKQARCIMDDYSGKYGELTAVLQYIYAAYISNANNDTELYTLFRGVAITEMMHHELLGEALTTFGKNPIIAGNEQYWNGSFVAYSTIRNEMLIDAIKLEEIAIANYNKAIACTNNDSLKKLIARIIEDEELHLSLFKDKLTVGQNS